MKALFIKKKKARHFLGSWREMTSYTDALSVITALTTSSPWYCVAAFWWCLVLHLLENHVPLDYPFFCIAGRAHANLVYTGLHTLPLIFAGWASVTLLGQESSSSPFPNLVLLSACPWQHHDTPLAMVAHQGRGHVGHSYVAEETKHIHLTCCCTRREKAKINSDTAW